MAVNGQMLADWSTNIPRHSLIAAAAAAAATEKIQNDYVVHWVSLALTYRIHFHPICRVGFLFLLLSRIARFLLLIRINSF